MWRQTKQRAAASVIGQFRESCVVIVGEQSLVQAFSETKRGLRNVSAATRWGTISRSCASLRFSTRKCTLICAQRVARNGLARSPANRVRRIRGVTSECSVQQTVPRANARKVRGAAYGACIRDSGSGSPLPCLRFAQATTIGTRSRGRCCQLFAPEGMRA